MQKVIKKVYLSIMVSILCIITLFTTTFAWIGFLDFSSFSGFDINIDSQDLQEYGIEISLTGEAGTFSNSIRSVDIKRTIMENMDVDTSSYSDEFIEKNFKMLTMVPCTTTRKDTNANLLNDFIDRDGNVTNRLYKFDIYLSAYHAFDSSSSEYYLNAYLEEGLFVGTPDRRKLVNTINYPMAPANKYNGLSNNLISSSSISGDVQVDSSSAVRLAIQKYEVIDKPSNSSIHVIQQDESKIKELIIYEGGTQFPTYDSTTDTYSFGGILEDDYNFALQDYNLKTTTANSQLVDKIYPKTLVGTTGLIDRGDKEFKYDDITNKVIDSSEKVGIDKMMKLSFCFWFEGWDADCFNVIDLNPVALNLRFTTLSSKDKK